VGDEPKKSSGSGCAGGDSSGAEKPVSSQFSGMSEPVPVVPDGARGGSARSCGGGKYSASGGTWSGAAPCCGGAGPDGPGSEKKSRGSTLDACTSDSCAAGGAGAWTGADEYAARSPLA